MGAIHYADTAHNTKEYGECDFHGFLELHKECNIEIGLNKRFQNALIVNGKECFGSHRGCTPHHWKGWVMVFGFNFALNNMNKRRVPRENRRGRLQKHFQFLTLSQGRGSNKKLIARTHYEVYFGFLFFHEYPLNLF